MMKSTYSVITLPCWIFSWSASWRYVCVYLLYCVLCTTCKDVKSSVTVLYFDVSSQWCYIFISGYHQKVWHQHHRNGWQLRWNSARDISFIVLCIRALNYFQWCWLLMFYLKYIINNNIILLIKTSRYISILLLQFHINPLGHPSRTTFIYLLTLLYPHLSFLT